jgi:hypothetical protein
MENSYKFLKVKTVNGQQSTDFCRISIRAKDALDCSSVSHVVFAESVDKFKEWRDGAKDGAERAAEHFLVSRELEIFDLVGTVVDTTAEAAFCAAYGCVAKLEGVDVSFAYDDKVQRWVPSSHALKKE